jgi:hypothetical protein
MTWNDDETPVQTQNPFADHDALLVQLSELRKSHELWRPIVETAKIVVGLWEAEGGALTPSLQSSIEMLSNMVSLAMRAERDANS